MLFLGSLRFRDNVVSVRFPFCIYIHLSLPQTYGTSSCQVLYNSRVLPPHQIEKIDIQYTCILYILTSYSSKGEGISLLITYLHH